MFLRTTILIYNTTFRKRRICSRLTSSREQFARWCLGQDRGDDSFLTTNIGSVLICGLVLWVNYLIGPYLMRFSLSEEIYKTFLMEVSHEILDVPLGIRRRMWFKHDGAPVHFHGNARQYLNNAFPNRWIGRNGLQWHPP